MNNKNGKMKNNFSKNRMTKKETSLNSTFLSIELPTKNESSSRKRYGDNNGW